MTSCPRDAMIPTLPSAVVLIQGFYYEMIGDGHAQVRSIRLVYSDYLQGSLRDIGGLYVSDPTDLIFSRPSSASLPSAPADS